MFRYSAEKDQSLKAERGIGFQDMINAIAEGNVIDVIPHHNKKRYPNQYMYAVNVSGYVYIVPFVEAEDGTVFLKTIYPSRKATKKYLEMQYEK